jgi:hypothetical protein
MSHNTPFIVAERALMRIPFMLHDAQKQPGARAEVRALLFQRIDDNDPKWCIASIAVRLFRSLR